MRLQALPGVFCLFPFGSAYLIFFFFFSYFLLSFSLHSENHSAGRFEHMSFQIKNEAASTKSWGRVLIRE